jgi:hypothetical protein
MLLATTSQHLYDQVFDNTFPQQYQHYDRAHSTSTLARDTRQTISSTDFDIAFDEACEAHFATASPVSTSSVSSRVSSTQSIPYSSTTDILSPTATSAREDQSQPFSLSPSWSQESFAISPPIQSTATVVHPMYVEPWLHSGQLTSKSASRLTSSSPSPAFAPSYSQHTSNPHITVEEPFGDGFTSLSMGEDLQYQLAKSSNNGQDTFYANYPNYTFTSSIKPRLGSPKSRPLSVASSIASESPVTPAGDHNDDGRQKQSELLAPLEIVNDLVTKTYDSQYEETVVHAVPKLDRTLTDMYNDELYSPNFTVGSASTAQFPMSPSNELFAQRLHAANSQHLAAHSPVSASPRDRSPFRHGSPLAPIPGHGFANSIPISPLRHETAPRSSEHRNELQDVRRKQAISRMSETSTPQTISPKDALLEYHEPDGASHVQLFPGQDMSSLDIASLSRTLPQSQHQGGGMPMGVAGFSGSLAVSQLPPTIQVPQQYPFVRDDQYANNGTSESNPSSTPTRPTSAETPISRLSPKRPLTTNADGGTYTCTYHGCTFRFDTPALLQKHKREGHRQTQGMHGSRRSEEHVAGMTSSLLNSQAGPHRCDRINPSTGKSCNTVFSRPYDLTRHEDTIHNARKQKVRCDLCTDEKTFSRADALTRHYRVCHPEVEFNGKQHRRARSGYEHNI